MSDMDKRLSDVESQRLELENNIAQLRKALQHYQTSDAEYEALKEELAETNAYDIDKLLRIQDNFDGEILTWKEIDDIFGKPRSNRENPRSVPQILYILDAGIRNTTRDIGYLQKQLDDAENQLAEFLDDATSEGGGQDADVTEILEELDEDDNVLSYQLKTPGDALPHIEKALKDAGIKDRSEIVQEQPASAPKSAAKSATAEPRVTDVSADPKLEDAVKAKEVPARPSEKKNVAFSEDTKEGDDGPQPTSRNARRVEQIMQSAKEQEEQMVQNPIIPEDEDPEEAAMRQAMLSYNMREVGAIVAEMEIEEIGSDEDDYEFEYSDLEEDEEEDEDEDSHGRYRGRVVTADYQERMLELEKRLGVRSRFTQAAEERAAADSESDDGAGPAGEGIGRIRISGEAAVPSAEKAAPARSSMKSPVEDGAEKQKGVRFAEALDIAAEQELVERPAPASRPQKDIVEPLADVVVERTGPTKAAESASTRKPSRFKQNRTQASTIPQGPFDVPSTLIERDAQQAAAAPTCPSGSTLAETLVERETNSRPVPPDEFDDSMIHDEVADEYQRMRKKFIQRDGGFLKEDESPVQPLEEAHGGPEKMSRFKAARLSRQ